MISLLLTGMAVTVVMLTKGKSSKVWDTGYKEYWGKQHDSSALKKKTTEFFLEIVFMGKSQLVHFELPEEDSIAVKHVALCE